MTNKKKFIKVPNQWYKLENDKSFMGELKYKRFTMWFILNAYKSEKDMTGTMLCQITDLYNTYSKLEGFGTKAKIRKLLCELKEMKLIRCNELNEKTLPNTLLNIELVKHRNEFQMISLDLFNDKINEIQPIGLYLYCFLFYAHNKKLKGELAHSIGYAEYSLEFISKILKINKETVNKGIKNIKESNNLIEIESNKVFYEKASDNKIGYKTRAKRYYVYAKYKKNNPYFIK